MPCVVNVLEKPQDLESGEQGPGERKRLFPMCCAPFTDRDSWALTAAREGASNHHFDTRKLGL